MKKMIQIFTTQLQGKLNAIKKRNEENFEDCARVLSQALIGDGRIFIHGYEEMAGVVAEAIHGEERLPNVFPLIENGNIANWQQNDRIIIFTRFSTDSQALALVSSLRDKGATIIAVASYQQHDSSCLSSVADFYLDLMLDHRLIPGDEDKRFGFPSLLIALYVYHCLCLTTQEILEEYED